MRLPWYIIESIRPAVEATLKDVPNTPEVARAAARQASELDRQGHLADAMVLGAVACALADRCLGPDDLERVKFCNNLAETYHAAGRVVEAAALHEDCLQEFLRLLGRDHPHTLAIRNNLAGTYRTAGRATDAVATHEESLREHLRVLGPDHPQTLISRNNLAEAYHTAGRLAEAVSLHQHNLDKRREVLAPGDPATLRSRDNLAAAYRVVGRVAEAISLHEESLAEDLVLLGPDHQDTLASRDNLAEAYLAADRAAEAADTHEESLREHLRLLGPDHPHTLASRNNLAEARRFAGRLTDAEAIALHGEILADNLRVLGADHPFTLTSRDRLATAYGAAGQCAKALILHRKSLAESLRVLGPDHPATLCSRSGLARAYAAAGRLAKATTLQEESLNEDLRVLGPDHPDTLIGRANLMMDYRRAARFLEAEQIATEAVGAAERIRACGGDAVGRATSAEAVSLATLALALAGLRVRLGRGPADVLDAVERGMARSVLDLLQRRADDGLALAHALADAGRWSANRLSDYVRDVRRSAELRALEATATLAADALRATRAELHVALARLAEADRDLLPAAVPRPLADVRSALSPGEVLLVYGWCPLCVTLTVVPAVQGGEPRSFLIADVPEPDGADSARVAEAGRAAAHVRECLLGEEPVAGLAAAARAMFDFALPPDARAMLAGATRVVVVPSGPLHDIPLDVAAEAISMPELTGRQIVTAPSASVYAMLRERSVREGPYWPGIVGDPAFGPAEPGQDTASGTRGNQLAAAERGLLLGGRAGGLSRLPRARTEADQVSALFSRNLGRPVVPLVDAEATVANVQAAAVGTRVLHVGAHAILGGLGDPMGSAVVLAPDPAGQQAGLLRLDDLLARWRDRLVGCELVVLSCCQSGRGVHLGDSLMALPIAFFHAGARCVLASLWPVHDTATWLLMRGFYERLLAGGPTADAWSALAVARANLRNTTLRQVAAEVTRAGPATSDERVWMDRLRRAGVEHPFAHPCYWAAFVLIGATG